MRAPRASVLRSRMPIANIAQRPVHAVRFYPDSASLAKLVAGFLGDGFVASLPAIIIATTGHRDAILDALSRIGFDVERLQTTEQLIVRDAHVCLAELMVDGLPDPGRFRRTVVPLIEKASAGRADSVVRAYGEMVDVLWQSGQTVAATRLEVLWNELATTHDFSLLCGYAMGNFYKDADRGEVCRQHTHVMGDQGEALTVQ